MSALDPLFEQFLRERVYLKNVTRKNPGLVSDRVENCLRSCAEPPSTITRSDLQRFVIHLRDRGVADIVAAHSEKAESSAAKRLSDEAPQTFLTVTRGIRLSRSVTALSPK
jgi:hypothetical protein